MRNPLNFLWLNPSLPARFRTGVSLHSHTLHSQERLGLLRGYRRHFPLIRVAMVLSSWQHLRATGKKLDISRVLWTPPLSPAHALRLEAKQIHDLGAVTK